jgi:hypothetical protein
VIKSFAELKEQDDQIVQAAGQKSRAFGAMLRVATELGWPNENEGCFRVIDRLAVAEESYNDGPSKTRLMVGDQYRWLWGIRHDGTVIAPLEGGRSFPPDEIVGRTPYGAKWYYWDTVTLTPISLEEAHRLARDREEIITKERRCTQSI